jgi:hypothetical protein
MRGAQTYHSIRIRAMTAIYCFIRTGAKYTLILGTPCFLNLCMDHIHQPPIP